MNFRKISLAAAAFAVLVPALSQAGPERDALKACARLRIESRITRRRRPCLQGEVSRQPVHGIDAGVLQSRIHVRPARQRSEDRYGIARASCSTDAHGAVVTLSPVPLDVEHPAPASLWRILFRSGQPLTIDVAAGGMSAAGV
jgi:hypothetical protein